MDDDLAEEALAAIAADRLSQRARGRVRTVWRWFERLTMVVLGVLFAAVFVLLILDTIR